MKEYLQKPISLNNLWSVLHFTFGVSVSYETIKEKLIKYGYEIDKEDIIKKGKHNYISGTEIIQEFLNDNTVNPETFSEWSLFRSGKNNDDAALFHDKFLKLKKDWNYFVFDELDLLSLREQSIVLSLAQWLGTKVGNKYLKSCGYEKVNREDKV